NRVGEGLADKQLAYNPLHREGAGNVWVHNYPKPRLDTRRKIVAPAIVTRVSPRLADNRARPASGRLHRSSRHRQRSPLRSASSLVKPLHFAKISQGQAKMVFPAHKIEPVSPCILG